MIESFPLKWSLELRFLPTTISTNKLAHNLDKQSTAGIIKLDKVSH